MIVKKLSFITIRILLAVTFLWVVADRISLLGPAGNMGVVWGDFDTFLNYTATLNPWFPRGLSDVLGYVVTILEVVLAILLLSGIRLKEASLGTMALLLVFIFSMTLSLGVTAAFDFILFTIVLLILAGVLYLGINSKNVNSSPH